MTHAIEKRLTALSLSLPDLSLLPSPDLGWICIGDALHIGGQLPFDKGQVIGGRIGSDLDAAAGIAAARCSALSVLAQIRAALAGDWSRLRQMARITVFLNAAPPVPELHPMADAASELLLDDLGDWGKHVRTTAAVSGLPMGAAVQIEASATTQPKSATIGLFP